MAYQAGKGLNIGGRSGAKPTEIHPRTVEPDENAIVIPADMLLPEGGNVECHVIPQERDGVISLAFRQYTREGIWEGKLWSGYNRREKSSPPTLTVEGALHLTTQLQSMLEDLGA